MTVSHAEIVVRSNDQVWMIAGSRIPLETVVFWFNNGITAEEIADKYPALSLAQVYSVIAYYLNHREAIDADIKKVEMNLNSNPNPQILKTNQNQLRLRLLSRKNEVVMS